MLKLFEITCSGISQGKVVEWKDFDVIGEFTGL